MSIRSKMSGALKQKKDEMGLSYNDISEQTGLSVSAVRLAMNNGGKGVGLDTFETLFKLLEMDVDVVLECIWLND